MMICTTALKRGCVADCFRAVAQNIMERYAAGLTEHRVTDKCRCSNVYSSGDVQHRLERAQSVAFRQLDNDVSSGSQSRRSDVLLTSAAPLFKVRLVVVT